MITKAKQDFCTHDFNIGFCPDNCLKYANIREKVSADRKEFLKKFTRKEWKNPITKISLIEKMQQFHTIERYLSVPDNVLYIRR